MPVISSMGAGNKLDPTAFVVTDLYKTSVCPLARAMRTLCRKRGVRQLKVVYSQEQPTAGAAPSAVRWIRRAAALRAAKARRPTLLSRR